MSEPARVRLLVVDGDAALRQRLVEALAARSDIEIVAAAMAGRTAWPKVECYRPDVVLVDLATAAVGGTELLERISRLPGVAVVALVAEAGAREHAMCTLVRRTGLGHDEFDRWATEVGNACTAMARHGVCLRPAAAAAPPASSPTSQPHQRAHVATSSSPTAPVPPSVVAAPARPPTPIAATAMPPARTSRRSERAIDVVGIGVSTGGPKALAQMLPMLPADLAVPVLIVQHMPPLFTASLAESLSRTCKLPVREARAGDVVKAGEVLIAPGGKHMGLERTGLGVIVRLTDDPPENSCRPAVDYLFRALATVYGAATCAVMMTGMGEDGFAGCRQLAACGARLLAQNEATCTVYGMPRGPITAGIAEAVALEALAGRIAAVVAGGAA